MIKYIIIGLTGTTGAGKSTVAKVFENTGCKIIDADKTAREIMIPPSKCLDTLCSYFGNDIIDENGQLKRKLLAQKAFSSKEKTALLNSITHPFIVKKFNEYISQAKDLGYNIIVLDAPQLFESKSNEICDITIAVTAPLEERLKRIMKRDNITREQGLQRISAQLTDEFFKDNCTYIINNDTTADELTEKAQKLISEIKQNSVVNL